MTRKSYSRILKDGAGNYEAALQDFFYQLMTEELPRQAPIMNWIITKSTHTRWSGLVAYLLRFEMVEWRDEKRRENTYAIMIWGRPWVKMVVSDIDKITR